MCRVDQHIILSRTENGMISWCKCCKKYTLAYRSCCIVFENRDFEQFRSLLQHLKETDYPYQLNESQQALLKTPSSNIGFCLTRTEANEVRSMVNEAFALNELFQVIYY